MNLIFFVLSLLTLSLSKHNATKPVVLDVQIVDLQRDETDVFTYNLLDERKAVMINLEYSTHIEKVNELQVKITNKLNNTVVCHFKYSNNLCVMDNATTQASVKIKCLSKKCSLKLLASQRTIINVKDKVFKRNLGPVGEIYHLQKMDLNSILQIHSQRGQEKVQSHSIEVYSNFHTFHLETEQLNTNSAIFGLKPVKQDSQRYIYIENRYKNQQRLKVSIKSHSKQLTPSASVIDFIQNYGKHSHSSFTFSRTAKSNMQIDLRVFKPFELDEINLKLSIKGQNKQKKQIKVRDFDLIANSVIDRWFDFTIALTDAVLKQYSTIYLDLLLDEANNKALFFQIQASNTKVFNITIFDEVYFGSNAGQKILFSLKPQVKLELADGDKTAYMIGEGFTPNTTVCSLNNGCMIEIDSEQQCLNCTFSFNLLSEDMRNGVLYYFVNNDAIEGRIDIEQELYFKYIIPSNSSVQIVINTVDAIIYANSLGYQRCEQPTASCHQYVINRDNPTMIKNNNEEEMGLLIGIVGLERTPFKVRFVNHTSVLVLTLGQRLSYLMDDQQENLQLRLILTQKQLSKIQNLHFNLISPIQSLKLQVTNQQGKSVDSLEGYVSLDKMHIKSKIFKIKIEKINDYIDDFVHFTIIVTSNQLGAKLDSNTHYQKYTSQQTKKFLIGYDASRTNALNIYTQNLQKYNASMQLTIRDDKQEDDKVLFSYSLKKDHEFIDFDEEDICQEDDCELQISITNVGEVALQQSINLLTEDTVIPLDDSIWSSFEINDLSVRNHFYFIPRNANKSITILFTTDDPTLYITYRFFNTSISINPVDWPFVHPDSEAPQHIPNTQEINIDGNDTEFAACWPTCVILINLNTVKQRKRENVQRSVVQTYKILSTNSIIELPEDTKLQFSLANEQQKLVFILAKNILNEESLTFFTYYSMGMAKIKATLISFDKQFPLSKTGDFVFKDLQTVLSTAIIAEIIATQHLKPESVFIKISIVAITSLRMTLEYSCGLKGIYPLRMGDTESIVLNEGQDTWYQFVPQKDFLVKLYRSQGSALFKVLKCARRNYVQCLKRNQEWVLAKKAEFIELNMTNEQQINLNLNKQVVISENEDEYNNIEAFIYKSYEFKDSSFSDSIYYIWIYCYNGQLIMTANLRSTYAPVQLKEMAQYSDHLEFSERRNYLINVLYDRDTTISVRVLEGSAQVVVLDNTNKLLSSVIHSSRENQKDFFLRKQLEHLADDGELGQEKRAQEDVFRHIYVTVSSLTLTELQYIISYSIGASSLYLEDGVMIQKNINPQVLYTFYYRNNNKKQNAHLTLSSQILHGYEHLNGQNSMSVSFYYYPDASNLNNKSIFKPQSPPKRYNQQYFGRAVTNAYELPAKFQLYEIRIESESFLKITASVSYQQMINLLLDLQYPVKLIRQQVFDMVIQNPRTEYLQLKINKCDMSLPIIEYTNDAKSFKKGVFDGQVVVSDNFVKQFIKTKNTSTTLHLRLKGGKNDESLFTITASGSTKDGKLNANNYKPGNNGLIKFNVNKGKAQIVFQSATCRKQACSATFTYYLILSSDIDEVYSELNCASSSFTSNQQTSHPNSRVITLTDKEVDRKSNQYKYVFELKEKYVFVGVKGVSQNYEHQVRYNPIKVQNVWTKLSSFSSRWVIVAILLTILLLILLVFATTKLARRGYKPLNAEQ